MSDFIAQIKGELSLQDAETRMQSFLNKYKNNPLKIKLDIQQSTNNAIMSQMKSLGKSAGKAFSQGMSSNGFVFDELKFARQQQKFEKKISKTAQRYKKVLGDDDNATRWATDYHNRALKEQEKAFNNQLKMQERAERDFRKKLSSAKSRIGSGEFDTRSAKNKSFLDQYTGQDSKALTKARNQIKKISELQEELTSGKYLYGKRTGKSLSNSDIVIKTEQLDRVVGNLSNTMKQVGSESSKTLSSFDKIASANKIKKYYTTNTKLTKDYINILKDLESRALSTNSTKELSKINKEFRALDSEISAKGLKGRGFFDEIGRGFRQIGQFVGTYGLLQQIPEVMSKMINETYKVDDAMTQLQMATNVSDDSAKKMMTTYSQMGKELKATATDVSASATEWLKQGKSISESQKLANDSIVLSKIGDLSSQESTKTITAAMKSYNLSTSEVMNFIDQISAIDMASATDVGGLSQAFNEVAANAKLAGIETEKLLSYAAVIGETTQEGMASIGTSLNAIFTRMGNIKLSRLKDYNTGEDLSNVETVLRKNGIYLRDTESQFREFDIVLDETASKWKTFDSVTQRAVAQAFAGTHHFNDFTVLMENYAKAQEYATLATNSSGEALQKYEHYKDSLKGKNEAFKNQFQELSTTFMTSDFMSGITETGTSALEIFTKLIDKFGVLGTVLGAGGIGFGIRSLVKNLD